ncbi:cellulose synthase complex periplasmic endoglucanase BcsZ [Providencia burhodogranariea]|uniref:cellulase n=1 Tax=Providencia burhodogranariea DSM 19968 TaxID=1141662 RepID=K8WIA8_9GAMM|nr:cellulose synthase complex periplasmic endoglucanase BcsZ [Providencia burhodogranariea]EKT57232.1 endo-1,4-D-glucanase [Providencia burhodogranariea DSM 19968]
MRIVISCILSILFTVSLTSAQASTQWPEWDYFKQEYISSDGRVIDPSTENKVTTSEGQSYALFFALVANDKEAFQNLLEWTENNLSEGDITSNLPAWLWGKQSNGNWGVIDSNSASDSDAWIAYSLLEAGRLWNIDKYKSKGLLLLKRIANEETMDIPGLGWMLLPGKVGFVHGNEWKLNPSYQPPQLMARFAQVGSPWKEIEKTSIQLLQKSSVKGFVPDWIWWKEGKGLQRVEGTQGMGSYDSIRSYLWIGMLPENNEERILLIKQWQPMLSLVSDLGYPPERVDVSTGKSQGYGNVGMAYALLPIAIGNTTVASILEKKIETDILGDDVYYSYVLKLFSQGSTKKYFTFDKQGQLIPNWKQ